MSSFQEIGTEIGALVTEKNQAYGSLFETVGEAMRLLYPNGISPRQMQDALLLTRIWDKMMRIATDKDAFGESPFRDIAGYGILGAARLQGRGRGHVPPCGSVSDAELQSKAQHDSAAEHAATPTRPSDSAKSELLTVPLSAKPSPNSSAMASACAPTATGHACVVGVGLARAMSHDRKADLLPIEMQTGEPR